jgi:chloramphenicol O-acetyltransferase
MVPVIRNLYYNVPKLFPTESRKIINKTNNYNFCWVFFWKSASSLTDLCTLRVQKLNSLGGIWDESWKSFPITRNDGTNLEILLILPSSIRRLERLEYISSRVKLEIHKTIDENYEKIELFLRNRFLIKAIKLTSFEPLVLFDFRI